MAIGSVFVPDLERIVQQEAFLWGDNATPGYFEPADQDIERQWAWVEKFLSRFPVDYSHTVDLACGHGRNSEKLAILAKNMTLVDVNPENIAFSKQKFPNNNWSFIVNNGFDLREIPDRSITFIYCLEAAVHFDMEIILSYIKEFCRILAPGALGFVHHSNFTKNPGADFRTHPGGRNFMSKEIFAHLCIRNGLEIIDQLVFDWGGHEADCFSLFRNTAGLLRPPAISTVTTSAEDAQGASDAIATGEKTAIEIKVFEPATPENLNGGRYLLANGDLRIAFGDNEEMALQHFYEYGFKEDRRQFTALFLASRRSKFTKFRRILYDCDAFRFPIIFGRRFYSTEAYDSYTNKTEDPKYGLWDTELQSNPDKLYAEIGTGLRHVIRTNCAYLEVNASLTADVLIEPIYKLPFRDASLDGIGCFTILEIDNPWKTVVESEFARVLKSGGRIFVGASLLQQALSTDHFIIDNAFVATKKY